MSLKRACVIFTIISICSVCTKQQSVVIIGAGAAGLAATTRLLAHNITDVTVLEAEDRFGGRVKSVPFADAIVELGAEWVDGQTGNVVYELVKDLNLLGEFDTGIDILFSDGKSLSGSPAEKLLEIFMDVTNSVMEVEDKNLTTGEVFVPTFTSAVKKQFHNDSETLELALKCLPLMEKFILSLDSSFTWHDTSAFKNYKHCPGSPGQTWQGKGFKQIFDVMAKQVPNTAGIESLVKNVIHLNKVVSKIDYNGDKPSVTCTDGSEYKADFVLFTPSLGVLKHDHTDIFHPALPETKTQAIDDLGIDAVMKIILQYDDIWWSSDFVGLGYNFIFTEDDEKKISNLFPDDPIKDSKSWITSIVSIFPNKYNQHALFVWVVGPLIPSIEQMSDERIKAGIDYLLTKFLKHKNVTITKANKLIKSNWYSNPHFRGSYSYETIKSNREGECVHMILAKAVKNEQGKEVLFFAGEATHMEHYATVHGAVETGYREADKILNIIANK